MNYRIIVFLVLAVAMLFCKSPEDTTAPSSVLRSSNYILGKWKLHITHLDDPNKSMNEANQSYLMNLNDKIFYTFKADSTYLIHSPNRLEPREGKWSFWKESNQVQVAIPGMDPKLFKFISIKEDTLTGSSSVTFDASMHFLLIRESNE